MRTWITAVAVVLLCSVSYQGAPEGVDPDNWDEDRMCDVSADPGEPHYCVPRTCAEAVSDSDAEALCGVGPCGPGETRGCWVAGGQDD